MSTVLLGSGTRHATRSDRPLVKACMEDLADLVGVDPDDRDVDWVHGAAPGWDRLSAAIAEEDFGWRTVPVPAKWQECDPSWCPPQPHLLPRRGGGSFCPHAGPRRNQLMLDRYGPNALGALAMPERGLGRRRSGTRDFLERASDFGLYVLVKSLEAAAQQLALIEARQP